MSAVAESGIKVGDGFFLFPGDSKARGTVSEVVSSIGKRPVIIRLSISGIDPDNIFHLNRSETLGPGGGVLFDASEGYVEDALAKNSERHWE